MAKVELKHKSSNSCAICGKADMSILNRPHSLHKTKRIVKPNFQKRWGVELCQNCFRTVKKHNIELTGDI